MNVFLPYERDLKKSVQSLDDARLNKQILECLQLLNAYVRKELNHESKVGYTGHPVYLHFTSNSYNIYALVKYAVECCNEYMYRFEVPHKLSLDINKFRTNLFNYPDNIDLLYTPYFMRGSLGQPEYIRTHEGVSQLFQDRLNEKWLYGKRKPVWTKRNRPEFFTEKEIF